MNNLFGTQAQAAATGITTPDTQDTALSYQPSYNQQQQATSAYSPGSYYGTQADVYAEYPELAQNALNQATIIGDAGQLSATSGGPFTPAQSLGLMDPQIAQDLMRSRTFDPTDPQSTEGLLSGFFEQTEDEDEDIETGFWGGGSPHG